MWLHRRGATLYTGVWTNTFVQAQFFAAGALLSIGLKGHTPHLGGLERLGIAARSVCAMLGAQRLSHLNHPDLIGTPGNTIVSYGLLLLGCSGLFFAALGYESLRDR